MSETSYPSTAAPRGTRCECHHDVWYQDDRGVWRCDHCHERAPARPAPAPDDAEREAVEWIGCVRDELVMAGGAPGDRTVALANLRALITERDALRAALAAARAREGAAAGLDAVLSAADAVVREWGSLAPTGVIQRAVEDLERAVRYARDTAPEPR